MTGEESDRLFEAYRSLKALFERIPRETDFAPEPAFVWSPGGTRLVR